MVFLAVAVMTTLLSLFIGRIGESYHCGGEDDYMEQARDVRGIPIAYLYRSVQSTGCGPLLTNGDPLVHEDHFVKTTNVFLDIVFWYIVLLGFEQFFKVVDKKQK